jgi:hypothetical protein
VGCDPRPPATDNQRFVTPPDRTRLCVMLCCAVLCCAVLCCEQGPVQPTPGAAHLVSAGHQSEGAQPRGTSARQNDLRGTKVGTNNSQVQHCALRSSVCAPLTTDEVPLAPACVVAASRGTSRLVRHNIHAQHTRCAPAFAHLTTDESTSSTSAKACGPPPPDGGTSHLVRLNTHLLSCHTDQQHLHRVQKASAR